VRNHTADTNKTRLSCLVRVGGVNTIGDKTKLIATGSRQDKTVLSVVWTQFATRQDSFVSSAWRCEQAVTF